MTATAKAKPTPGPDNPFPAGTPIYYYSRTGETIPGTSRGYMVTMHSRKRPRVLMRGNWPTGDRTRWVTADRCETQEDCP